MDCHYPLFAGFCPQSPFDIRLVCRSSSHNNCHLLVDYYWANQQGCQHQSGKHYEKRIKDIKIINLTYNENTEIRLAFPDTLKIIHGYKLAGSRLQPCLLHHADAIYT